MGKPIQNSELGNGKAWQSFSLLRLPEQNQFLRFLKSPFFNQREDLVLIWRHYRDVYEVGGKVGAEVLWQSLFPNEKLDTKKLTNLLYLFLQQLEQFIAHRELAGNKAEVRLKFASWLHQKGQPTMTHSTLRQAGKDLDKSQHRDSRYFQKAAELAKLRFDSVQPGGDRMQQGFQEMNDRLDQGFALQKLQAACSLVSQRSIIATSDELRFLQPVLEQVERENWTQDPVIGTYCFAFHMLNQEKGDAAFQNLTERLQTYEAVFAMEDLRTLYLLAVNFCIRKLNEGKTEFLRKIYDFYQNGLSLGWLFEFDELSPWAFKNIVSAGLKLGEYEATHTFMHVHADRLPEALRQTIFYYNLAEYHLATGNYQEVLRTLRFLNIKDPLTQIRARIAQLKAAYELQDLQLVEYQLNSLDQLLRRRTKLSYHKEHYRNFIRFSRRMIALVPGDQSSKLGLHNQISQSRQLVERDWLIAKLEVQA